MSVENLKEPHFTVSNEGSFFLLTPHGYDAQEWIVEHIDPNHLTWGESVVVERGYINDVIEHVVNAGFLIE